MKYSRGTVLRWTPKAMDPRREGARRCGHEDRMIVLSHDEVMFVHCGIVEQMDMYKTQDSYVTSVGLIETLGLLRVDIAEVKRVNGQTLVKEFGLKVTKTYEGRRA